MGDTSTVPSLLEEVKYDDVMARKRFSLSRSFVIIMIVMIIVIIVMIITMIVMMMMKTIMITSSGSVYMCRASL